MMSTSHESLFGAWPTAGLVAPLEVLVDGPTERVIEGASERSGARRVVSMRDLGHGAHAARWVPALSKLLALSSPALAHLVGARVVDDRFLVLEAKRPRGTTVHARLRVGPLDAVTAVAVAQAALAACQALDEAGLSAAGLRLASAVIDEAPGMAPRVFLTTYGLHVDQPVDPVSELRELALRTLAIVGATTGELGSGIHIPAHALSPVVGELLREAAGLVPEHPIASARELAAALRIATHARA